jgi:hypothetical protein
MTATVLTVIIAASTVPSVADTAYFPFNAGATYTYEMRKNGSRLTTTIHFGKATGTELQFRREIDMHVSSIPLIVHEGIFRGGDDGLTEFSVAHTFMGNKEKVTPVLRFPLKVGTTWTEEEKVKVKITKVGATVTVPAGTFKDCVIVTTYYKGKKMGDRAFAPKVGMVKDIFGDLIAVSGVALP